MNHIELVGAISFSWTICWRAVGPTHLVSLRAIGGERVAPPKGPGPPGEGSERSALELEGPMDREPKTARYTIRRDSLGWSVVDAMTGNVACRDKVTLIGLDAEDADDIADGLSWIARRDEERRNGPG